MTQRGIERRSGCARVEIFGGRIIVPVDDLSAPKNAGKI